MKGVVALLCGLTFGVGLAVSGMTDTARVLGFLDLFGNWVPDLAFVMGGAVCVTLLGFRFVLARQRPLLAKRFFLPENTLIDRQLLIGAALFGTGWGVYGFCPGPALSALLYLDYRTSLFVVAMFLGMALASRIATSKNG